MTLTQADIEADLYPLDLAAGDAVTVHNSPSSIGWSKVTSTMGTGFGGFVSVSPV